MSVCSKSKYFTWCVSIRMILNPRMVFSYHSYDFFHFTRLCGFRISYGIYFISVELHA